MSSAFGDVPGSRQLTKAKVDLNYHYYAIQKNNKDFKGTCNVCMYSVKSPQNESRNVFGKINISGIYHVFA
jgi:hypothetical protein